MSNNSSSQQDWPQIYQELQKNHNEAYLIIEKAIKFEEDGNYDEAIQKYECGLSLLDKALEVPFICPTNPDVTWEKACVMIQKLKKTREDVLCRITEAQKNVNSSFCPPPSYDEAMSGLSSPVDSFLPLQTYSELGAALQDLKVETGAQCAEILYEHDNVRLYFITPDGSVVSASEPDMLKIVRLEDGGTENRPQAYLQVGEWIYPLVPGVSPCFRTGYGAFILPDVHAQLAGSAIGLILPEDADASVYEILNDILQGICSPPTASPRSDRRRRDDYSFSISRGMVKGAHYISKGLVMGAEKASGYMNNNTPRLIQHLSPEENPSYINPNVSRGIRVAKDVTGTAVQVTGYVAQKIGCATMALGRYLAPHIQRQGTRLLSSTTQLSEQEAADKMGGALQVAAGAVEGFGTVYAGLENSAAILASCLANNTVKIVEYKYGQPAGQVTGDTLYTVGNVFTASSNVKYFTPKGLVKTTAKSAGKAVVEDYRVMLQQTHEKDAGPSKQ